MTRQRERDRERETPVASQQFALLPRRDATLGLDGEEEEIEHIEEEEEDQVAGSKTEREKSPREVPSGRGPRCCGSHRVPPVVVRGCVTAQHHAEGHATARLLRCARRQSTESPA